MLELNLYRNKMTTSKGYGMIYGRVEKKETYDLKKLAADMGVDTTGIKKKDALIAAITAVEVTGPALDTEDVIE